MNAISLFSSSGIGDLGLKANGIRTVIANELLSDRATLFKSNYPDSKVFSADIWDAKDQIISYYRQHYSEAPFVVLATPPCQGMSSNGMGKMLSDYRRGLRPKFDERNRLIVPALDVICSLRPLWIIFENVPNMQNTLIYDQNDEMINIVDYIFQRVGTDYVGKAEVIDAADFGVPQNRKRLITILSRDDKAKKFFQKYKTFLPPFTHGLVATESRLPWISVRDAIYHLPPLDGKKGHNANPSFHPLHKVSTLDDKKYFWVKNTPEGETAFNNQCVNPTCGFEGNLRHGTAKIDGINQSCQDTPLYCIKCGSLLPRPCVKEKDGTLRLMKGYVSAYKRMKWDEPASTLTQNFQYACSDNKLHPAQNRVLSLYEGLIIQTIIDYSYEFKVDGNFVSDSLIKDSIGESVPPHIIDLIMQHILKI